MEFAPGATSHWAAVMALDDEATERAIAHARDADEDTALAKIWLALMRGEARGLQSEPGLLLASTSATRDRYQVIELAALRAMVALSGDHLSEAVASARRASLMSRTEALLPAELLANLVLARVRRHSGKPYLAMRILDALAKITPHHPSGWLDWERVLAGGARTDSAPATGVSPGARAAQSARRLLLAAQAGRRQDFDVESDVLVRTTAGFRDIQDEARALVALLDPDRGEPALDIERGDHAQLRYGLFGVGVLSGNEEPGASIFVVARSGERGRRILRDGLGLFGACRMLSFEDGTRRTHGRTDAGLAVLTLAAPTPLPEDEFWRRVYGFAYSHAAHRGVLDVLLHRMRARLATAGSIGRGEGTLSLELREAIAVADPLCSPPAAARILSALARQPLATADAIAGRLGITVRAVQMALHDLVSDGACVVRRSGRQVHYQLEDSTFSEPTSRDAIRPNG